LRTKKLKRAGSNPAGGITGRDLVTFLSQSKVTDSQERLVFIIK